jgi:mRNA-degrading endonuclease toxin of MazEF toxin-antitoxin module
MPSQIQRFNQWDVWWIDQPSSRTGGQPPQLGDPSFKNRMFIIVSPSAHLRSGDPVCLPIGSKGASKLFHLSLKAGEGGVLKDCYVWCNEIYTIKPQFFLQRMGSISHLESEIKLALKKFLDIF